MLCDGPGLLGAGLRTDYTDSAHRFYVVSGAQTILSCTNLFHASKWISSFHRRLVPASPIQPSRFAGYWRSTIERLTLQMGFGLRSPVDFNRQKRCRIGAMLR